MNVKVNEKCLSKATAKALDKHLGEIYNFSKDRNAIITSLKKTIIFD